MRSRWIFLVFMGLSWMCGCDRTPSRSIDVGGVHLAYIRPGAAPIEGEDPWALTGEGLGDLNRIGSPTGLVVKLAGKFTLEGDFEVVADYAVERLERPTAGDGGDGVEVAITSPDRSATVFCRRRPDGEGRGFYHFQKGMPRPTDQFDGVPARTGRIGFRRVDATLFFLAGPPGGSLATMGSVDFFGRDPITEIALVGAASPGTTASSLRFDRVAVRGEDVVRTPASGGGSPAGAFLVGFLILGASLVVAAAYGINATQTQDARPSHTAL